MIMKFVVSSVFLLFSIVSFSQTNSNLDNQEEMSEFIKNAQIAFSNLKNEQSERKLNVSTTNKKKEYNLFDNKTLSSEIELDADKSMTQPSVAKGENSNKKLKSSGSGDAVFEIMSPTNGTAVLALYSDGYSSFTGTVEVDGASTNKVAYDAGSSTTIDFTKSNLAYTSTSPTNFILNGIKDGGTYTLAVQGTAAGQAAFESNGFTFKSKNNGANIEGSETLYTFLVMGTTVYYSMTTGL